MGYKSIGYQTRSYADSSIKICGGSFGGAIDAETVDRLVKAHFTVKVKPSGCAVFVDKGGREVWLSITVDAGNTVAGVEALREWRIERNKEEEERVTLAVERQAEIDALTEGLTHEEIIKRLKQ